MTLAFCTVSLFSHITYALCAVPLLFARPTSERSSVHLSRPSGHHCSTRKKYSTSSWPSSARSVTCTAFITLSTPCCDHKNYKCQKLIINLAQSARRCFLRRPIDADKRNFDTPELVRFWASATVPLPGRAVLQARVAPPQRSPLVSP